MLAGGPAINLLTAPLFAWGALAMVNQRSGTAWLAFAFLTINSAVIGTLNLLPFRTSTGQYSDGARLLQILTRSPLLESFRATSMLLATTVTPLRPRDLDPAVFQRTAALRPSEFTGLHMHVCAATVFQDQGKIAESGAELAAAENTYETHAIKMPALLYTSFVHFEAVYNRDARSARIWWDRMPVKKLKLKNVDYWLAASALAWIEGRSSDAEEAWKNADLEASKLPEFGLYQFDRDQVAQLRIRLDEPAPQAPESPTHPDEVAVAVDSVDY